MVSYILRRLALLVPVVFLLLIITFSLIHMTPGSPVNAILGQEASKEQIATLEAKLGLDQPLHIQFIDYLANVIQGDFGNSLVGGQDVVNLIITRLPVTLELSILAILLSLCISIPLGLLAARYPNSWIDHFGRFMAMAGSAIPTFWFALVLVYLFSVTVPWFPAIGWVPLSESVGANLHHLVIPVFALSLPLAAMESRMLRGELLEVLNQVYIQVARAKGIREKTVFAHHAFRNALLPLVTVIGLQMGSIIGGAVIVESIFSLPGMGQLVLTSILQRDYPLLNGTVLFMGAVIIITNLIVDVLYALLDPRIRYS